jgi:hypothetical protein
MKNIKIIKLEIFVDISSAPIAGKIISTTA